MDGLACRADAGFPSEGFPLGRPFPIGLPGGVGHLQKQFCIAIVSRNEIEREGLRRVLTEKAFQVVATHRDHFGLDLDALSADGDPPPLVIIDASSDEESLETCRYVHEHWPRCKIVIFAPNCQGQTVFDAFRAGIDGYVVKHISVDSLAEMLKLVALGEKMIPSQVFFDLNALKLSGDLGDLKLSIGEANLSDREVEIMQGLIRGDPNKVISRSMAISEATVKVHVKSILRKLGVMNRTQAAIWGMSRGITDALGTGIEKKPAPDRMINGSGEGNHPGQFCVS
jgi:two-component system nitrate/nitrite response regulator NarL